jgi:hypothetical protein
MVSRQHRDLLGGRELPQTEIPVREYFAAVLPGLNNTFIQRVTTLTPMAWATKEHHAT